MRTGSSEKIEPKLPIAKEKESTIFEISLRTTHGKGVYLSKWYLFVISRISTSYIPHRPPQQPAS